MRRELVYSSLVDDEKTYNVDWVFDLTLEEFMSEILLSYPEDKGHIIWHKVIIARYDNGLVIYQYPRMTALLKRRVKNAVAVFSNDEYDYYLKLQERI